MISHHECQGAVDVGQDADGRTRVTCLVCGEVIVVFGSTDPDQERDSSGMLTVAHEDATEQADADYADDWRHYQRQLASPPPGWFPFGPHPDIPLDIPLEFWGEGLDGLPIWQRPQITPPPAS